MPAPDAQTFDDILRSLRALDELEELMDALERQRNYVAGLTALVMQIRVHREEIARYHWLVQFRRHAAPGDGGVFMMCERGHCYCHLEALAPPHTVVDFQFAASCASPDVMRQLIRNHCLAGMEVLPPSPTPDETPSEN